MPDGFHGNFEGSTTVDFWDRYRFADYDNNIPLNEDVYFTVTYDGKRNEEEVFINGDKKASGIIEKEGLWDDIKDEIVPECDEWLIGICGHKKLKGCLKGKVYCFRIYGRALDDTEVIENYEKAKFYHENLKNENT